MYNPRRIFSLSSLDNYSRIKTVSIYNCHLQRCTLEFVLIYCLPQYYINKVNSEVYLDTQDTEPLQCMCFNYLASLPYRNVLTW